ncbi:class I SAM-dependent methyltransferase [Phenylobacterium sp.]|uniref:class I SAM-dependent methyltransferase n=1 Tax=Phenylobacterium sp. TaxID=1871053 RepID=UPI0028119AD4|nr:class I SAM-dependent methyltransferase [Phenylobacterium sp.]
MAVRHDIVLISLDPPYRLGDESTVFNFIGWAEVDDENRPNIRLSINGVDVAVTAQPNPKVRTIFPDIQACSMFARVNFPELFAGHTPEEPFLLNVEVKSDGRTRLFEYEVSEGWLQAVFGRPVRRRRIPPEHLQIRVTGAAAGQFHVTGRRVADQIAGILARAGRPLTSFQRILDFGCGPGRVISSIKDMHPAAELFGSDIDGEAIGWARANLADIGDFRVNGPNPPLPFADESFDLIYSISIFTHLPEDMQHGMLAELRRILKPGGVLLTTKLNPEAYDLPDDVRTQGVNDGFVYWGDADATEGLPGFYRLAYHTEAYIRRVWGEYFNVLHVGSHDLNNTQDAVLLLRPKSEGGLFSRLAKAFSKA